MPAKQVLRPCGWCGVDQTARGDREHFKTCPKRPKQVARAQERLKKFNDKPKGKL